MEPLIIDFWTENHPIRMIISHASSKKGSPMTNNRAFLTFSFPWFGIFIPNLYDILIYWFQQNSNAFLVTQFKSSRAFLVHTRSQNCHIPKWTTKGFLLITAQYISFLDKLELFKKLQFYKITTITICLFFPLSY